MWETNLPCSGTSWCTQVGPVSCPLPVTEMEGGRRASGKRCSGAGGGSSRDSRRKEVREKKTHQGEEGSEERREDEKREEEAGRGARKNKYECTRANAWLNV